MPIDDTYRLTLFVVKSDPLSGQIFMDESGLDFY